jgi:hypothetical protein
LKTDLGLIILAMWLLGIVGWEMGISPPVYTVLGSVFVTLPAVWTASAILRRREHK